MKKNFRFVFFAVFLVAALISFVLYVTTGNKSYSDQTIKKLSDKLQAHVMGFLENNYRAYRFN